MPPLDPQRIIDGLPGCRMLISVINSGFDIGLAAWRRIVDAAACPVWFDIHSLALTQVVGGTRRYRPLPEWPDWVAGVTYLQANVQEVASMLGDPETLPGREGILGFGRTAIGPGRQGGFPDDGEGRRDGPDARRRPAGRLPGTGPRRRYDRLRRHFLRRRRRHAGRLGRHPGEAAAFGVELASEAVGAAGVLNTYELIRNRLFRA